MTRTSILAGSTYDNVGPGGSPPRSTSLAFWAGETGVATMGVVVVPAVVLLARAKVWQEPKAARPVPSGTRVAPR